MKIGLKGKLISAFLGVGLTPICVIGLYTYISSSKAVEKLAFEKLTAVRNIKGEAVKRYFQGISDQMLTFSHNLMVIDAMREFSQAFKEFPEENDITNSDLVRMKSKLKDYYVNQFGQQYQKQNAASANEVRFLNQLDGRSVGFQYHYIAANPHPLGSKENLDRASDQSKYSEIHKRVHPPIREFLQKFGYYDIFLVDINTGHIVYSVFKELDYATSLLSGPYSDTNFASAFKTARDLNDRQKTVLVDYKKYTPSYEAPASFIAAPVFDGDKKVGVAIFQMPIDRLNAIMGERSGMGETGETYLFGMDKLMRSDSFRDQENYNVVSSFKKPESGTLDSVGVSAVLRGEMGQVLGLNYLGKQVLSAYTPLEVQGLSWGLIAEIEEEEAFQTASTLKITMVLGILVAVGGILLFAGFMSSSLASRIRAVANRLTEGSHQVSGSATKISASSGELSKAATTQAGSLQETVSSVDEISAMVKRNAESAKKSASVSEKSTSAASRGKQTVSSMIDSIKEISNSNNSIMQQMQQSNQEISEIVTVISEIGEKTKVINDIVFQTKLLSFNASVEAARAGEHGKGFAVVAEEVGNLASMSGTAAKEITDMLEASIKKVTNIVEDTKRKVEDLVQTGKAKVEAGTKTAEECGQALDEILGNVSSVNEMVKEIATASHEQSQGVEEVTNAMGQLDQLTQQNTSIAQESSQMSSELESQAHHLNSIVEELMNIVGRGRATGPQAEQMEANPEQKIDGQEPSNVVPIASKSTKSQPVPRAPIKVAVGSEYDVPKGSDNRFEEV